MDENEAEKAKRREIEESLLKKKALESKAFNTAASLSDRTITEQALSNIGQEITPDVYDDIVEERSIVKLCGYPVCSKHLGNIPKQKYCISYKEKAVYDVSVRKSFCSDYCFSASKHFRSQISSTPLWLRHNEQPIVFSLLKRSEKITRGEMICSAATGHKELAEEVSMLEKLDSLTIGNKNMPKTAKKVTFSSSNHSDMSGDESCDDSDSVSSHHSDGSTVCGDSQNGNTFCGDIKTLKANSSAEEGKEMVCESKPVTVCEERPQILKSDIKQLSERIKSEQDSSDVGSKHSVEQADGDILLVNETSSETNIVCNEPSKTVEITKQVEPSVANASSVLDSSKAAVDSPPNNPTPTKVTTTKRDSSGKTVGFNNSGRVGGRNSGRAGDSSSGRAGGSSSGGAGGNRYGGLGGSNDGGVVGVKSYGGSTGSGTGVLDDKLVELIAQRSRGRFSKFMDYVNSPVPLPALNKTKQARSGRASDAQDSQKKTYSDSSMKQAVTEENRNQNIQKESVPSAVNQSHGGNVNREKVELQSLVKQKSNDEKMEAREETSKTCSKTLKEVVDGGGKNIQKSDKTTKSSLDRIREVLLEWVTRNSIRFVSGNTDYTSEPTDSAGLFDKAGQSSSNRCESLTRDRVVEPTAAPSAKSSEAQRPKPVVTGDIPFDDVVPTKNIPSMTQLKEDSHAFDLKVREYYGVKSGETEASKDAADERLMLPPVDNKSQMTIRRRIVLDKINRVLSDILCGTSLRLYDVRSDMRQLVSSFELSSTNILLKPHEWILMTFVLLNILAVKNDEIRAVVREERFSEHIHAQCPNFTLTDISRTLPDLAHTALNSY